MCNAFQTQTLRNPRNSFVGYCHECVLKKKKKESVFKDELTLGRNILGG